MISVPLRSIQQTRWTRVALTGIRRIVPLSTVCVVVMAFGAGGSSAALTTRAETPSKEWVVDGSVMALAATSSALYVGGDFTAIGPPTGAWVSVDATGAVAPVRAEIYDSVSDAVSDGAGGWFIQGEIASVGGVDHSGFTHLKPNGRFGTIGGETRRGVAALDPLTGKATGWDAGGNGNVFTLALAGDAIYVGGRFTSIGGSSRKSIAALDIGDGSALRWDVSPDDDVDVIGIVPDGTEMIVGGDFTKIAGGRRDLAAFDLSTGFLTDWRPIAPFTALALAFGQGAATLFVGGDSELLVFGQAT